MKKYLLILCALLLTAMGASAQIAAGTVVHECEADNGEYVSANDRYWPGHWTNASLGIGNFHINSWSTEASDPSVDPSGMTVPFVEYWLGGGNQLAANTTITHITDGLTELLNGFYSVSIKGRAYNESGSNLTNGSALINEGITFNANGVSVDVTTGTQYPASYTSGSLMVYGTYNLLAEVTDEDEGTLTISWNVASSTTNSDWLAWKDLVVTYLGEDPKLSYVVGDMNTNVYDAMVAAVDAWNNSLTDNSLFEAAEAAIEAAEESVAQYAEIASLYANLDDAGKAVWDSTTSGIAYTNKTLTIDDDYSTDMGTAQAAQTTEGSDMSYVLTSTGTWTAQSNNALEYPIAADPTITASYNASGWSAGNVLWKTVTGLQPGTYTVTFYGAANYANTDNSGTFLADGATAFANDASVSIDINYRSASSYSGALMEDELHTLTCKVIGDELEFGLSANTSGSTGNWYLAKAVSLTLVSLGADIEAGDEVHKCEAEFDHWSISGNTNGSFQLNTWSTEADPSGLETPFIEYWVGSGSQLSDAVISHTQLTGIPEGLYEVSIFARAFNEQSLVDVSEGITFNANKESIDLNKETHATYNHVSAEEYGTYKVYCEVDEDGTLDIDFTLEDVNCDWLAFKNLEVTYMGSSLTDLPTLTAETGTMNTNIEEEQTAALAAYEETPTLDSYNAAYQAVECARVSIAFYASIAEVVDKLDETGMESFETSTNGAYTNRTLVYQDMTDILVAAQLAQTTANTDWSYVLLNTGEWYNAIGATNFQNCPSLPTAHEIWSSSAWTLPSGATSAEAIYKRIEGLLAGTYTISFYAYGSEGANASRPLAFANDVETTVDYASALEWNESSLYTLTCTVDNDGILDFGMKTQGAGNWYVMEENSLTLVALAGETIIEWDMTDAGWGTMILPFAADVPDGLTLYAGDALTLDSDGTTITVGDASESIAANTPYLVSGDAATYTFTGTPENEEDSYTVGMLTGTLVDMSQENGNFIADSGQYVLQNHEDEDGPAFYPITSESEGVTLNAYHCYLTTTANVSALHLPGMSTGIVAVESDVIASDAIYDLSGRRVAKAVKGVYIMNGKKVLVK